jgi:N-acetylglucosamine-6-sulfatase
MVSSVDWMPTVVDILGGDSTIEGFDGKSFAYELTNGLAGSKAYEARSGSSRQAALIEYWGLGNVRRGAPGTRECGPSEGACAPGCVCHLHLVDTPNNTYIGVRLYNDSHNLAYAEFYPDNMDSKLVQEPYFYELYDVGSDQYQLTNLAIQPSPENKVIMDELHTFARQQFACKGDDCV